MAYISNIEQTSTDRVEEKFTQASMYADQSWDLFEQYVHSLAETFDDYLDRLQLKKLEFVSEEPGINKDIMPPFPSRPDVSYQEPAPIKAIDTKTDEYDITQEVPVFTANEPWIDLPNIPQVVLPPNPGTGPQISDPVLPTRPAITMPTEPILGVIVKPVPPQLDTIQFEGELPDPADIIAPDAAFVYNEEVYRSLLGDELDAKILADIIAGGTGLDPAAEEAIYIRGRNRLEEERQLAHNESLEYFASRGHALPPGALQARLSEIDRKFTNSLTDLNRDIIVKQAELTWQNLKATITAGLERENTLIQYANQRAQRAFEAAKFGFESGILIFNAKVSAYNARLEAYKSSASVFAERVRAQLTELEAYRIQMEGAKLDMEIQQLEVALFTSSLRAIEQQVAIYNAQMHGAELEASVERLKVEAFRARVMAYQSEVQAKTAEYNMYQAKIAGELGKVNVYESQVKAFTAEMQGYTAEAQAVEVRYRAQSAYNQTKIAELNADIERYKAQSQANLATLEADLKIYDVDGRLYAVSADVLKMDAQTQIAVYSETVKQNIAQATLELKNTELYLNNEYQVFAQRIEALKAGASVTAQALASSLTSVNASASIGYDGGFRSTYSYDKTKGKESGPSTVNQHIWHEG